MEPVKDQGAEPARVVALRFTQYVVDNMTDAVIWTRQDGSIAYVNRSACNILGYTSSELLALNVTEIDPDTTQQGWEDHWTELKEKGEAGFETMLRKKSGERFAAEFRGNYMALEGTELACGIARDITNRKRTEDALKKSEEKFAKAFHNDPDVIILTSIPEGKIIEVNEAITRLTEYTKEEAIGKTTVELNLWAEISDRHKYINEMLTTGRVANLEVSFRRKSGEMITALISGEILELGSLKYILSLVHDITERKIAETALMESEARLRELNATKDKFFSIIAHDLKGPFSTILGFSEVLIGQVRENDLEGIEQFAGIIHQSASQAMDLLTNLLVWSRSQSGQIEFNPEYFELHTLISEVKSLLEANAKQKNIGLSVSAHGSIAIYADKAMISTVLRNLISNAIKFTNPGGSVVISGSELRGVIEVAVSDNGIGIRPEDLGRLFRIGESISTPGTANEKGTGLGLILCREFIEKNMGSIRAESKPGKGSRFVFTLPKV